MHGSEHGAPGCEFRCGVLELLPPRSGELSSFSTSWMTLTGIASRLTAAMPLKNALHPSSPLLGPQGPCLCERGRHKGLGCRASQPPQGSPLHQVCALLPPDT